jgi:hypothetical protein
LEFVVLTAMMTTDADPPPYNGTLFAQPQTPKDVSLMYTEKTTNTQHLQNIISPICETLAKLVWD